MRFISKADIHWMLAFVMKILAWIAVPDLIALPILWLLKILHLFTLILIYEALFLLILGVMQILSSYIYRANSIPYRSGGGRSGLFDFKKFARLKPEERKRYRQEGIIMVVMGLVLLFGIVIAHYFALWLTI